MATGKKPLSVKSIDALKRPGKYSDHGHKGLALRVISANSRQWVYRYTLSGRQRECGLGSYPDLGLAAARAKRNEYAELIATGIDPVARKRADEGARKTFDDCASDYIEANQHAWKNPKTGPQWTSSLATYASPVVGAMPVGAITATDVLAVLRPIWYRVPETASRVRSRIEIVLSWAKVAGYRSGDNPAAWRDNLKHSLPARAKVRAVKHFTAMPYAGLPSFMRDLAVREGIAARCLAFAVHTASRSGEARGCRWSEIDFDAKTWTVPAGRMKASVEHEVPLTDPVVALLKALPRTQDSDLVFVAPRGGQLSDMSLTAVLRRMGHHVTQHGFRSSFREWAGCETNHPSEVCEHALAHRLPDAAARAYQRSSLFPKRIALMRDWSEFLTSW